MSCILSNLNLRGRDCWQLFPADHTAWCRECRSALNGWSRPILARELVWAVVQCADEMLMTPAEGIEAIRTLGLWLGDHFGQHGMLATRKLQTRQREEERWRTTAKSNGQTQPGTSSPAAPR